MKNVIWNEEVAKETASLLIDSGVYSIDFKKDKNEWTKLPDGTITPCYCNCRYVNRSPIQSRIIVNFMETMSRLKSKEAEIVVGLATAGIPFSSLLADRLNLPVSYVRSKPKGYGQGNLVECNPQRGLKALVVDDLLYTGSSLVKAVEALSGEYGIETIGITTIVSLSSWECKENEWNFFKNRNITMNALTSYDYLLDELLNRKKIDNIQYKELQSFYLKPKTYEWK